MFRAAIELLFTILIILIARAVLTTLMKGLANAGAKAAAPPPQTPRQPASHPSGELHKDPMCGTYVAESTAFRRQTGSQTFYYCSEACREKHTLVAR